LFKSTNGGTSFTAINIPQLSGFGLPYIADMVVSGSTLYVTAFDAWGSFSDGAVLKSTNAGTSWTDITPPSVNKAAMGRSVIAQAKSATSTLYLMVSDPNGDLLAAYKTTNAGVAWTKISQDPGAIPFPYLGTTVNPTKPTDPCSADGAYGDDGQCWYDIYAAVDPGNANIVYFGGVDVAVSTDGGATFKNVTNVYNASPAGVHPDQHAIAFGTTAVAGKRVAYFANDGGVYSSSNAGANWANLNTNLNTLEVYWTAGGTNYANQRVLWNGMQDNGTAKFTGSLRWQEMFGGDGGFTAIDPTDQRIVYEEYVFGDIHKSIDGGITWNEMISGLPAHAEEEESKAKANNSLFITPFIIDPTPANHNHLVMGQDAVFETIDGASTWCQISQVFDGGTLGDPNNSPVSSLAIAPATSGANSEIIYAGMSTGTKATNVTPGVARIYKTAVGNVSQPSSPTCVDPATLTWSDVSIPLPFVSGGASQTGTYVSDLAVDATDPNIVYATISVYGNASFFVSAGPHVYKTTDGGSTWTVMPEGSSVGQLPATNYNSVLTYASPNAPGGAVVIVAGDMGVYLSSDGGSNWSALKTGLPNVPVYKVKTDFATSTLIASTHGRGVWTMPIPQSPITSGGLGDTVGVFHRGDYSSLSDQSKFLLRTTLTGGAPDITAGFGLPGDIGLTGDWNGDGIDTVGVYRPSSNTFMLKDTNDAGAPVVYSIVFGTPGDIPVIGDWTKSGRDSIGVYRPSTGQFLLRTTLTAGAADRTINFATVTAANRTKVQPFVGDFNGDGFDTVGAFAVTGATGTNVPGTVYYSNTVCTTTTACSATLGGSFTITGYTAGDIVLFGDWMHIGTDGVALFRASTGTFFVHNTLLTFDPTSEADYNVFITGTAAGLDLPVAGHYDKSGTPYVAPQVPGGNTAPSTPAPTPESAPTFVPGS